MEANKSGISILTLITMITAGIGAVALTNTGFAEVIEKQKEQPSTAHVLSINIKDGKLYNIIETYFDRLNMRCRMDHYLFQESCDSEGIQVEDMTEWETLKKEYRPKCVDVYGAIDTYEICWNREAILDFDIPDNMQLEQSRAVSASEVKIRPVCTISSLPYVPVTSVSEWEAFFATESIAANRMIVGLPDKPIPNKETGEYVYNTGLYEEHFWGPGWPRIAPDYVLEQTWYEAKYLLPIKSLIFGVRQDKSRYLNSITLTEYDVVLEEGIFDPEQICASREGFSILKQDLKKFPQKLEKMLRRPVNN